MICFIIYIQYMIVCYSILGYMIVSYNIDPKALDEPLGYLIFSLKNIYVYIRGP